MGVCSVPVISTVCHAAGSAAGTIISAPFDWIAEGVGNAAEWMFKGVWQLFDSTTAVDVTDPNYLKVYDVLFGVAIFLMLLFFCLQLITGLIQRDPGALHRAAIGLAKSVLGSFLVVTLTGLALRSPTSCASGSSRPPATPCRDGRQDRRARRRHRRDQPLRARCGRGHHHLPRLPGDHRRGDRLVQPADPQGAAARRVVLAPIALSGQSWDHARGWFTKWASFVVALIVSKLVVVVIFLVAINQMNAPLNLGPVLDRQPGRRDRA